MLMSKRLAVHDVKNSHHDVKQTPWRHTWVVVLHPQVSNAEIPIRYARKSFKHLPTDFAPVSNLEIPIEYARKLFKHLPIDLCDMQ